MREVLLVAGGMNFAAFAAFGLDKALAQNGGRRIREADLFFLAAIGGSIGAIAGMYVFRHKTLKPQFRLGLPIILLLQTFTAAYLLHRSGLAFV